MTSNHRQSLLASTNHRATLTNQFSNDHHSKVSAKGRGQNVSEMSPEARKAMLLVKGDSKENLTSKGPYLSVDTCQAVMAKKCNIDTNNNSSSGVPSNQRGAQAFANAKANAKTIASRTLNTKTRDPPRPRKMTAISHGATTATARSRSTLSRNDPTYSISDNNESCYNYGNKAGGKDKPHTLESSNDNNNNNEEENMENHPSRSEPPSYDDDIGEADGNNSYNEDKADRHEESKLLNPKSFVLALNKALEENQICRLRGDITDKVGIAEPGKVRALDGGRLTNAQEVVVNVCHEDDRELVFHDDDDESLDNAKTISEIRINIWMKYNEEFQPDTITDDLDIGVTNDLPSKPSATMEKAQLKVPNSTLPPRGRENSKTNLSKVSTVSRNSNSSKGAVTKRDSNNNKNGSGTSRSRGSSIIRDSSSTRISSARSTDGSKRSTISSGKKDSYLGRKVKT